MHSIKRVLTAQGLNERFKEDQLSFEKSRHSDEKIILDVNKKYQKILGFGGAFTEATAYNLSKVSEEHRAEVIKAYFDQENGLGYSIGRVHIHSCDFALGNYTYIDEHDETLDTFTIAHDEALIIPLIKDAEAVADFSIPLLASPWSPPAFMKTNKEMNNGGKLLPEYYGLWANYYVKFIEAYEEKGLNIWGVSVQNEPAAVQVWDSCIYTAEEERDFVKNHLGPTLHKNDFEDINVVIWDHNRDLIVERASTVLQDKEAAKYVWGTGIHWYMCEDFDLVGQVHDLFPDKHLLFTEGCQEGGVKLGEWFTGERYGRNIIGDLNNWNEGFLDWNLVLNEFGGPNHVGNYCDAPIIADTVKDEIHYNSSYYYIGHFSKYIRPGAQRIGHTNHSEDIQVTSFMNVDGTIAVVLMNETDLDKEISLVYDNKNLNIKAPNHSIQTIMINE